jgi:hypothetical protein
MPGTAQEEERFRHREFVLRPHARAGRKMVEAEITASPEVYRLSSGYASSSNLDIPGYGLSFTDEGLKPQSTFGIVSRTVWDGGVSFYVRYSAAFMDEPVVAKLELGLGEGRYYEGPWQAITDERVITRVARVATDKDKVGVVALLRDSYGILRPEGVTPERFEEEMAVTERDDHVRRVQMMFESD